MFEPDTFVYNAAVQSPEIKNFNDNIMEISEESVTSACNVDKYNIVIILGKRITADGEHYYVNNYEWANGSIDNIGVICICDSNCYFLSTGTDSCSIIWKINKKPIPAPYVEEKYYYTGDIITPIFHNYDRKILDISGDVNGIEIGDYIVCFEIKDKSNYIWAEDVIIDSGDTTTIVNGSQSSSSGKTFTGSTTLPAGTYSFSIVAYNYSSTGVGSSPTVTYSITFS